jgi:hypothetical protein
MPEALWLGLNPRDPSSWERLKITCSAIEGSIMLLFKNYRTDKQLHKEARR